MVGTKNCRCLIEKNCRCLNFEAVVQVLFEEIEERKDKDTMTALGILSSITKSDIVVCLFTMDYVLSLMNVFSNYFQKATLGGFARLVKITLTLGKRKQREKFDEVWIPIEKFTEEYSLTLSAPRPSKKRKPAQNHVLQDCMVRSILGQ